jgi:nitrate reductase delta subunit
MQSFKLLSALLCYPEPELLAALPVLREKLKNDSAQYVLPGSTHEFADVSRTPTQSSEQASLLRVTNLNKEQELEEDKTLRNESIQLERALAPLLDYLESAPLIRLQENYVATFDRSSSHSLHLFEHIHGESRDRGQAMVDLLEEYRKHGFELSTTELPDYVPLFLEFLAQLPEDQVQALLGDAIHVLATIGNKLSAAQSPYACVFEVLRNHCTTEPQAFTEPPVRDMDEALETFGAGADGVEPLLRPSVTHTMQFQPKPTPGAEPSRRPIQSCS